MTTTVGLGETVYFNFTTSVNGVPTALSGSPVISGYVGSSTTERTTGITLTASFDSRTGFNQVAVAATGGNGYAAGERITLVITTGTVGGYSVVGTCVADFVVVPAMVYDSIVDGTDTLQVDVTQFNGTNGTFASGRPEVNTSHIAGSAVSTSAAQIGVNVVNAGGTAWGSGAITSGAFAAGAITASAIAADAIGASELAADAVAEIADAVWDEDATAHQTQGTFGQAIGDPVADTNTIYKAVVTDATGATVGVDAAAILDDTGTSGVLVSAASVRSAVGLAAANLDTQLTAIDDFIDTEVAAILAAVDTEVAAILALLDDPRGEPGQGAPGVSVDLATKVDYLYKLARNKVTQTSTTMSVFADDGTTVDHKATVSDDGTTYTRGELATGP